MGADESLLNAIATDIATDKFAKEIRENRINNSTIREVRNIHDQFMFRDGFLFRNNLMYVPDGPCRIRIVKECHDDALAGHFGVAKTLELISRSYWWPQPSKLVKQFVKTCYTCACAKAVHHLPYGLLQLCQFQIVHGPPSRRILSPTSPTLRESIQYWWWLIDSQRWRILFHVRKQF